VRVALYTAIYGRYDSVKPVPLDLGVPAYLFTDLPEIAEEATAAGWFARVVPHHIVTLNGDPRITGPMLAHKYWKCHPDKACPDVDASIWIDGSMTITEPDFVKKNIEALGDDDWACVKHPARGCIYPEADYSATLSWRYQPAAIKAQSAHYSAFHPANWGLIATGHNIRRHTPDVLKMSEEWWQENLRWSHQDQLSLPVLLRIFDMIKWNYNLPWHSWWHLGEHG
jgi:hypothetical protein